MLDWGEVKDFWPTQKGHFQILLANKVKVLLNYLMLALLLFSCELRHACFLKCKQVSPAIMGLYSLCFNWSFSYCTCVFVKMTVFWSKSLIPSNTPLLVCCVGCGVTKCPLPTAWRGKMLIAVIRAEQSSDILYISSESLTAVFILSPCMFKPL